MIKIFSELPAASSECPFIILLLSQLYSIYEYIVYMNIYVYINIYVYMFSKLATSWGIILIILLLS